MFGVALYASCSASLLIINKVAMYLMPDASFLLFCQFVASSLACRVVKLLYKEVDLEFLEYEKAPGGLRRPPLRSSARRRVRRIRVWVAGTALQMYLRREDEDVEKEYENISEEKFRSRQRHAGCSAK